MKLDALVPVGDPHFGSKFGLMPPWARVNYGSIVGHNQGQDWLWRQWNRLTNRWLDSVLANPRRANATRTSCKWGLVCMADMVEGRHDKNEEELIDPDVMVGVRLAEAVYKPLADEADITYMLHGTRRHGHNIEGQIGEALGAEPDPTQSHPHDPDSLHYAHEFIDIEVRGCLCWFKHKITGGGKPWTRGGNLARALAADQLHAVELKHRTPNVVVRAHAHHFDWYGGPLGLVVVTGPWKLLDPWAREHTEVKYTIPSLQVLDFRQMNDGLPTLRYEVVRPAPDPVKEH